MGGQVGGSSPWEEGGGNLQTDAEQFFLFVPIPAKAKMLGLLSIYKFSLIQTVMSVGYTVLLLSARTRQENQRNEASHL
jgi:hypothetical protein